MSSNSVTIPTSLGGWNTDSAPDAFPAEDATVFKNLILERSKIKVRPGFSDYATFSGTSGGNCKAIQLSTESITDIIVGTRYGLWSEAGGSVYSDGTNTKQWQFCTFNKRAFAAGFTNLSPAITRSWDGTTLTSTPYTGAGSVSYFCPHRNRMYMLGTDSGTVNLFYGGVNAVSGTVTLFDTNSMLRKAGYLVGIGSLSRETGAGDKSQLALFSSTGEILIYDGDYPGATDWVLVRRLNIPPPITDNRSFDGLCQVSDDLWVLTVAGVFSLQALLSGSRDSIAVKATQWMIDNWDLATYGSNDFPNYSMCYYGRKNSVIINMVTNNTGNHTYDQIVVNLGTGSVYRWSDIPVQWFFDCGYTLKGVGRRNNNNIYTMWTGTTDDGAAIAWEYGSPWTQLGTPNSKKVSAIKPVIKSAAADSLTTAIDVDLLDSSNEYTSTLVANTYQQGWLPVIGTGKRFRFRLSGSTSVATELGSIEALVSQGSSK
jgi:hypothetical protein